MSHCVIWYHIAGKRRLAVEKKYFICTRFFKVYIEMDHLDENNSLKRKGIAHFIYQTESD